MRIKLKVTGEKALFRNTEIPGANIATDKIQESAVLGILGNILGLWRDFDNPDELSGSKALHEWIQEHGLKVESINYTYESSKSWGQHRYKDIGTFTQKGKSGPKNTIFHKGVVLNFVIDIDEVGYSEIVDRVKRPIGTPFLGRSDCLGQIEIE